MSFLLDTCTISEPKQKQPSGRVLEWLDAQDESKLFLSVLTIGEIRKGITRLESGRKKSRTRKMAGKIANPLFAPNLVFVRKDIFSLGQDVWRI